MSDKLKTFVTGENIKDLIQKLNQKNQEQAILIYNDVNKNTAALEIEADRAKQVEQLLDQKISNEVIRSETAESNIQNNLNSQIKEVKEAISGAKTQLYEAINTEVQDRKDALTQHEITYLDKINTLDKAITGDQGSIDRKVSEAAQTLRSEFQNVDSQLSSRLSDEITNRQELEAATRTSLNAINSRVDSEVSHFNSTIDELKASDKDYTAHIINRQNPHGVTAYAIGAAEASVVDSLQEYVQHIDSASIKNIGDQKIIGSLTISKDSNNINGDLIVEGDLKVNGTTITVDRETSLVEDNFILVNSQNNALVAPAGLAIRLGQDTAYGIAYNPSNECVALGQGVILENGDFIFNANESNPILTRANSSELEDGHILIWDAASKTAKDGGAYDLQAVMKDFTTWEAHHALVASLDNTNKVITDLTANKQDKEDISLITNDKKIVGAINEVASNLDTHKLDYANPHKVTWGQINTDAFIDSSKPMMDGQPSSGTLNYAARADHIHPIDVSRAPVNHASGSSEYGKATTSLYGHVQVDDAASLVSENPVQNKIITKYVDDTISSNINSLNVDVINLNADQTIKSIKQLNGKIEVEFQDIKTNQQELADLENDLNILTENLNTFDTESKQRDAALQESLDTLQENSQEINAKTQEALTQLSKDINEEALSRSSSDKALDEKLELYKSNLEAGISENSSRITQLTSTVDKAQDLDLSIENIIENIENGTLESDQCFMLGFVRNDTDTGWKAVFRNLDDGELT